MFQPLKVFAFAKIILFLTLLRDGVKFSMWVKIDWVSTSETVKCVRDNC